VSEPTLYLFDGYNLLHAGDYRGVEQLIDELASFVALQGARGVVVFDGAGEEVSSRRLLRGSFRTGWTSKPARR